MSYSFNIRAASVAAAVAALPAKFDEVVAGQPIHARDREAAIGAATAVANLLVEPAEGQEVSLSVNGYVQWRAYDEADDRDLTAASVGASAHVVSKTE